MVKKILILTLLILSGCTDSSDPTTAPSIDVSTPTDSTWKSLYQSSGATGFYLKQLDTIPTRIEPVKWDGMFGYVELTCGRFGFDISSYPDANFWVTQEVMVEYDRSSLTCASHSCRTSNVVVAGGIVSADFSCTLN